jgi:DNA-nicking Smr family endonuclease
MNLKRFKKWFRRRKTTGSEETAQADHAAPQAMAPAVAPESGAAARSPDRNPNTVQISKTEAAQPRTTAFQPRAARSPRLSRQGIPILRPDEDLTRHFLASEDQGQSSSPAPAPKASGEAPKPGPRHTPQMVSGRPRQTALRRSRLGIRQLEDDADLRDYFMPDASGAIPGPEAPAGREAVSDRKSGRRRPPTPADRHGIPRLDNHVDVRRYFAAAVEEQPDDASVGELADAFKASLGSDTRRLMKKKTDGYFAPRRLSLKEKLQRYPSPQAQLDLHGDTALMARQRAETFLRTAAADGSLTVRIIVGKGLHSESGAVLPDVIEDLLVVLKREGLVLTFVWDNTLKRKSGAVVVYLEPPYGC